MGTTPSKPLATTASEETLNEKRADSVVSAFSSLHISPKSASGSLSLDSVAGWESEASSDPKTQLARTILSHSDIRSALISRNARIADTHVFNNVVDFKTGPVTNQKSSGRCWLFATTNVIRYAVMKKLKLKEFELSQVSTYPFQHLSVLN